MAPSRAVLIAGVSSLTGLSSGTGRATALRLHRAGWPVYAGGRNLDGLKDLANEGINTLRLDVTDEESMAAAVEQISNDHGAVGVLINNAAYSLNGLIGVTPMDEVRRQFETNLFGLARMAQLALPGMQAQGSGRIVMMSSIFGLFATPGRGYYQATKHALEAVSDSLRQEVERDGIKVVVIQPSPILGQFVPTTVGDLNLPPGSMDNDRHREFWDFFVKWHGAYREVEHPRGRGRTSVRAAKVARVIEKAVTVPNPHIRYRIGLPVTLLPPQRAIFGERAFQRFLNLFFPAPGKPIPEKFRSDVGT
jgi:NAD(P)-dependent dehydrogenase (short-subunit alcohol dehydrogenase family)